MNARLTRAARRFVPPLAALAALIWIAKPGASREARTALKTRVQSEKAGQIVPGGLLARALAVFAPSALKPDDHAAVLKTDSMQGWRNLTAMLSSYAAPGQRIVAREAADERDTVLFVWLADFRGQGADGTRELPKGWDISSVHWPYAALRRSPAPTEPAQSAPLPPRASGLIAFAGAAALWTAAGWLLLRRLPLGVPERLAAGLVAGALWTGGWTLLWLRLGMAPSESASAAVGIHAPALAAAWFVGGRARKGAGGSPDISGRGAASVANRLFKVLLAAVTAGFLGFTSWLTLSGAPWDVASLGQYGYKAKVWFEEGWPEDFPGGEGWRVHTPDYPPALPLLWTGVYTLAGGVDLFHARLTAGLFLAACAVLWALRLRRSGSGIFVSLTLPFAVFCSGGLLRLCREGYPEPLMLACGFAAWTVLSAEGSIGPKKNAGVWTGAALIAGMAWCKSEGVFAAGLIGLWLLWKRHPAGGRTLLATALVFGGWRLWLASCGVGAGDFSMARLWEMDGGAWRGRFEEIAEGWRRHGFSLSAARRTGGGAYLCLGLAFVGLIAALKAHRTRLSASEARPERGQAALFFLPLAYAALFTCCYLLSVIPLAWHLNGLSRLAATLLPACVAILTAFASRSQVSPSVP